jgi:peptidyl-tRNA hydrolase, PTH1 family
MSYFEKIIVGLGNPGSMYRFNRHNTGFLFMEEFYRDSEIKYGPIKRKKNAFLTVGNYSGGNFLMVQPRVFMNGSGKAFFDIDGLDDIPKEEILVIHDDISFEIGKFRLKQNGGDGGHKGVRSIIETLDTSSFSRLKIGILNLDTEVEDLSEFVLENFTEDELRIISSIFPEAIEAVKSWLTDGMVVSMNRFNIRKEIKVNNG